jgi:glucosyl-3-phosphoglycerate synthase
MSDFFQDGPMATLHRLGPTDLDRLESELKAFAHERPVALILPCHARELGTPALQRIVRELAGVRYLDQIVVGLDCASPADHDSACRIFGTLPQARVIWNDGPRVSGLIDRLALADFPSGEPGKGRNLWLASGFVLAARTARVVVAHDCDISTYSRDMLARLCYPVVHPTFGFDFCKGFSARFSDRLNGRVMRLLLTPLVRSLHAILGANEVLTFLDAFRYPLSGEAVMTVDLLRRARIPTDWGVELGFLAEVFRTLSPGAVCQVDVSEAYDHKHQDLSPDNPGRGLNKMAGDIAGRLFRTLAGFGTRLDQGLFDSLLAAYNAKAAETLRFFAADAALNGLHYNQHDEEAAVSTFAQAVRRASVDFLANPAGPPALAEWNRVESTLPDFLPSLVEAVGLDRESAGRTTGPGSPALR